MAKPSRNSDPSAILSSSRTFFVTTKTISGCALLQTERNAGLLIDVMRSYVAAGQFTIHDFAVMPNHVHRLMTIKGNMSIEKAAGMIKGNFSFRLKKEFGYLGEIWQRGFSTVTARVNACPDTNRSRAFSSGTVSPKTQSRQG